MSSRQHFKVVFLGEGKVGKTSIILRYVKNQFSEEYQKTVQAAFHTKRLNIEGRPVTIDIWDTAGQEAYRALAPMYYRDSHGAILVYDITDDASFDKVCTWIKELRKMVGDIPLCIVGNKTDLEKYRNVSQEEAEQYSTSVKATHFHTSAKLNKGIDGVFLDITRRMLKAVEPNSKQATMDRQQQCERQSSKKGLLVTEEAPDQPSSSGGCCG